MYKQCFFPGINKAKTVGFMIISRLVYIKPYIAEKEILQKMLLFCNQIILQKYIILMTKLVSKGSFVTFSFISLVLKYLTSLMSKYFVSHLLFHIHECLQILQKYFFLQRSFLLQISCHKRFQLVLLILICNKIKDTKPEVFYWLCLSSIHA